MIEFGKLIIEGFCSIDNYEINLSGKGITIIRGRNGAGKTTLLSAINWVLYGTMPKDVKEVNTWKKYRTKEYQGTKITIHWENKGTIHQVIRCSNYTGKVDGSKGMDRLLYFIDNEHVKERKKLDIQKLIEADLGMSHELFRNSVMFGQGLKRLAQESASDKKDLFEEVFDVAYITKAKSIAKGKYDELSRELAILKKELSNLEYDASSYKDMYKELKEKNKQENLQLVSKISKLEAKKKEAIEKLNSIKFDKNLLTKSENEKAGLVNELNKIKATFEEHNQEIEHLQTNEGLSEFIDDIIKYLNKPETAKKKLLKLKSSLSFINNFKDKERSLKQKITDIGEVIWKIRSEESKHQSWKSAIKNLDEEISEIKEEMKNSKPTDNSGVTKYRKKYKEALELIAVNQVEVENLSKQVDNYSWLMQEPLGNKGLKSYIIESSLSTLNSIMADYAKYMGFNIEFGIDLETTKKDFYTLIEIDNNVVNYNELSGGQKQLVHIAMAFAMHEMTTNSKHINALFLDEVFEHLDHENIEVIVSLIKRISKDNKSIFIITHQDSLPLSNANTIRVDYKNGLTVFL